MWFKWLEEMFKWRSAKGAVNRLLHRKLSMAWEKWQYGFREWRERTIHGVLNRMLERHLSKGWESWKEWYRELMAEKLRCFELTFCRAINTLTLTLTLTLTP